MISTDLGSTPASTARSNTEQKMGKMLEVFKQANPKVPTPADTPSLPATPAPEALASLDGDDDAEMSFIEVGGRNEKMEASADVLACATDSRTLGVALP